MLKKNEIKYKKQYSLLIIILLAVIILIILAISIKSYYPKSEKTIIYSTDIALNGDFDDYYDLIAINTLHDCKLNIIIDGTDTNEKLSGAKSIELYDEITGKHSEYYIGGDVNFKDFDINKDDLSNYKVLINTIRQSRDKVDVVCVGSLRDIAILKYIAPDIFESKIGRIFVFAGDYEGTYSEWNVSLDGAAYSDIMNSGMDIYWIPCFQNGLWTKGNDTSYFTVSQDKIFEGVSDKLLKYFMYRWEKESCNYDDYVYAELQKENFYNEIRNLWCAPIFSYIDGSLDNYIEEYCKDNASIVMPFEFKEIRASFDSDGNINVNNGNVIHVFHINNRELYEDMSVWILNKMFIKTGEKITK